MNYYFLCDIDLAGNRSFTRNTYRPIFSNCLKMNCREKVAIFNVRASGTKEPGMQ